MIGLEPELTMMIREFGGIGATVDQYRNPAASGGTVGAATQIGTAIPGLVIPASDAQKLGLLPIGLGGGQVEYVFIHAGTAPIRTGDIVRWGADYPVEGTANWSLAAVCGLSLPS